jgi:hypothetical protein
LQIKASSAKGYYPKSKVGFILIILIKFKSMSNNSEGDRGRKRGKTVLEKMIAM